MEVKKYSYFEGKIVPAESAKVSIQTHALQYGTAVFGGIRGYYNKDKDNFPSLQLISIINISHRPMTHHIT